MKEIWKDIKGYKNLYQVSNLGRVKKLAHCIKHLNEGKIRDHYFKEKIMRFDEHRTNGRLRITLHKNNKHKRFQVHRLILETFIGKCPKEKQCCHKDDNPKNNKLNNLYWGTVKENIKDKIRNGKSCKGIKNGNSKLKDGEVLLIKKLLKNNIKQSLLAKIFKVSPTMIMYIKKEIEWKHIK
jgi:hypothetical protein